MIDDKIRDETIQYNINREAAKISALSSCKIDEYLTDEEMLLSDQSRMIEQAKFTSFRLGKVTEKEIKTIENQEEKQIKALEVHAKQLTKYRSKIDYPTRLRQKKVFDKITDKRRDEIKNLGRQINYNNSTYYFKIKGNIPNILFNINSC